MPDRQPWFKFHTVDWRGDGSLRLCSAAARGVWIEMLALMHESKVYGHLYIADKAPTQDELAGIWNIPVRIVDKAIAELEGRHIFDRTAEGVIVSRRMVRDAIKAERDSANGRRGGNPKVKGWVNPPVNGAVNGGDKARTGARDLASGFSLSDLSGSETQPEGEREREPVAIPPPTPIETPPPAVDLAAARFETFWTTYPRKDAKKEAEKVFRRIKPNLELFSAMLDAIERQGLAKREKRFIPLPASWLNGERWTDESAGLEPAKPAPRSQPKAASWRDRCEDRGHHPPCGTPALCEQRHAKADAEGDVGVPA